LRENALRESDKPVDRPLWTRHRCWNRDARGGAVCQHLEWRRVPERERARPAIRRDRFDPIAPRPDKFEGNWTCAVRRSIPCSGWDRQRMTVTCLRYSRAIDEPSTKTSASWHTRTSRSRIRRIRTASGTAARGA